MLSCIKPCLGQLSHLEVELIYATKWTGRVVWPLPVTHTYSPTLPRREEEQRTRTYQIWLHRCCHRAVSSPGLQGERGRLWVDPWRGWTGGWRWSLAAPGSVTHNGSTQYINTQFRNYFFHMCVQQVTYVTKRSWKKETSIKYSKLCHCVITLPTLGLYCLRQCQLVNVNINIHNDVAPPSECLGHETP